MDAKEFIRELVRMCKSNGETCGGCQIRKYTGCPLAVPENVDADILVEIVKDWSTEHPKKTNGRKFIEEYNDVITNAKREDSGNLIKIYMYADWWDAEYKE